MLRTYPGQFRLRSRANERQRLFAASHWRDRVVRIVAIYMRRSRTRRALAELPDHHLRDIGLSRVDVARETGKPFWR
jgi:uncharacterized protein YjiS (DUF1127 family)